MPRLTSRPPKYCRYRQGARVTIQGRAHYLPGAYNSKESLAKYRELVAQWGAGLPADPPHEEPDALTVAELLADYDDHARKYYGNDPKSRYGHMHRVVMAVAELYADLPAHEFTPRKLQTVRQLFVDRGNCRRQVNDYTRDVIAIFSWGAEQEMIPGTLVHSLREVRALRRGHTEAPEGKIVTSVPQSVVDATLPFLVPVLSDMVQLQLACGCRPGELCSMTPDQVDRSGDVWLYRPQQHKTAHHGHERVIAIGPKGQAILRKYLLRPADAPCFSPKEALAQYLDQQHERRTTPLSCGHRPVASKRKRRLAKIHDRYDVAAYRRAIERACDRAFPVPEELEGKAARQWRRDHRWTPHRLRHTAGTLVREQFGLDGAQAILGHRNARVTEVYSELNVSRAVEIARKLG